MSAARAPSLHKPPLAPSGPTTTECMDPSPGALAAPLDAIRVENRAGASAPAGATAVSKDNPGEISRPCAILAPSA